MEQYNISELMAAGWTPEPITDGGREIVITGVNIGDFGADTGERLIDLLRELDGIDGITVQMLTHRDVVRHRLVQQIIKAYEKHEDVKKRK